MGKGGAINHNAPETRAETQKEKDWFSNFQLSILLMAFAVLLFDSGRVAFSVFIYVFFPWTSKKTKQKKQCIPHTWDLSTSGWWSLSALFEPCSIRLAIPWGSWQLGFMKSRSHPWAVFSAQRSTLNFTPNGTKYFFWGLSVTCPSHILSVLFSEWQPFVTHICHPQCIFETVWGKLKVHVATLLL